MNFKNYKCQSEWARKLVARGRAEGRAEAMAAAQAKAMPEGVATAILPALELRGISVAPDIRQQINGCTDLATLDRRFQRALAAPRANRPGP